MIIQAARQPLTLPLRFIGGVILVLVITLFVFWLAMRPPLAEFRAMTTFLAITALVSVVVGFGAYKLGWIARSPQLKWTLMTSHVIASVLMFVNVWVTARLMFLNRHDLTLATILLIFAAGIAMSFGYFLSAAVTDNIAALNRGAQRIAEGRLDTRVSISGSDEVAQLARSFNQMAAQLEAAAQRQRELEALRRELIAWVGHDLRTPLASVRAIVEALADGMVEDRVTADRYLRTAKHQINELAHLIDDLFEMAQLDAGGLQLERAAISLSDLISDTIESFTEVATAKGVTLGGSVAAGVDPVVVDAQRIGRVLANLVNNAVRHTPDGGAVQVMARPVAGGVQVEVKDTGEGIPPEDLPLIFDRFYRADKSRTRTTGGVGLGLAITKGLVEAHGGTIQVTSRVGEGTTFSFSLPRAPAGSSKHPLLRTRSSRERP